MTVTVRPHGGGVACCCLDFHHRYLCRHIFAVLKDIVDTEDKALVDELSSEQYGQRIVDLIGATQWVGGFRYARNARALQPVPGVAAVVV